MKKRLTIPLFIILMVATSCSEHWGLETNRGYGQVQRAVLFYFAANNDLSYFLKNNMDSVFFSASLPSSSKDTVLLAFQHYNGEAPTLRRYYRTAEGEIIGELVAVFDKDFDSGKVENFVEVEKLAFEKYPAKEKGLVISSHGSGWMPVHYYETPYDFNIIELQTFLAARKQDEGIVKSIVVDSPHHSELDIPLLAKSMTEHYEYIVFDACFMSTVEVAYELRHNCDYFFASPTEIRTEGYAYSAIIDNLMDGGEQNLKDMCHEIVNYYAMKYRGGSSSDIDGRSVTTALIKCSELEPLAGYCREIFNSCRAKKDAVSAQSVQKYFRYTDSWFYDFDDYVAHFTDSSQYSTFRNYLDAAVISKEASPQFLTLHIDHYSGLSTYIPKQSKPSLNAYYKTLEWNKATNSIQE